MSKEMNRVETVEMANVEYYDDVVTKINIAATINECRKMLKVLDNEVQVMESYVSPLYFKELKVWHLDDIFFDETPSWLLPHPDHVLSVIHEKRNFPAFEIRKVCGYPRMKADKSKRLSEPYFSGKMATLLYTFGETSYIFEILDEIYNHNMRRYDCHDSFVGITFWWFYADAGCEIFNNVLVALYELIKHDYDSIVNRKDR